LARLGREQAQQSGDRRRKPARDAGDAIETLGREVLVAVAVGQHEPTDTFDAGMTAPERGQAQPAPGVVPDQRHVSEIERLQERWDPSCDGAGREVGVGRRITMRPEGPGGHDAAFPVEPCHQLVPHRATDVDAVNEHDRSTVTMRAVTNGDAVEYDGVTVRSSCRAHAETTRINTWGRARWCPRPPSSSP
jgi:hypothetical protein